MSDAYCKHIKDILEVEKAIIEDHIAKHKWCNHISDTNDAVIDFVQKFAWLMREVYCGATCSHKEDCCVNTDFRKVFLADVSDGELREYINYSFGEESEEVIKLKLHVIKHDIKTHKWLNKIENYEDAVRDFLQKFGWLIFEVYKKSKEDLNVN